MKRTLFFMVLMLTLALSASNAFADWEESVFCSACGPDNDDYDSGQYYYMDEYDQYKLYVETALDGDYSYAELYYDGGTVDWEECDYEGCQSDAYPHNYPTNGSYGFYIECSRDEGSCAASYDSDGYVK